MLRRIAPVALLGLATLAFTLPIDPLAIGSTAPMTDYEMTSTAGETLTLADVRGANGLLVIFSCNTCPYVLAWQNRYDDVHAEARRLGIGTILVNPNEASRGDEDSMEAMRAHAAKHDYTIPYVVDTNHRLADAFGATRTPDVFLFDADLKLVYRGAIDDNARDAGAVEHTYLFDAMRAMTAGESISPDVTRSIGCSIKRKA